MSNHFPPINLTRAILLKELRLQKNNIFFTIATLILGVMGLLSINAADPSVISFNPGDIRDALTYIIILPLLTLILPLMIGSTAAAAEKPLGVQAWQTALPLSLWRVTMLKFLVITGLLFIISGILPYIITFAAADTPSVNMVFRYTWPFWLGFLCAAIGYYSGTLARDDYQGLLISILPITLLIIAMTYADPLRLVFPAFIGAEEPLLKQHILAARLLLIAAIFIIGTMQLQRRQGRRTRLIFSQAAVLVICTLILTLINIVSERTALYSPSQQSHTWTGAGPRDGAVVYPHSLASVPDPFSSPIGYHLTLDQNAKLPYNLIAGHAARTYNRNYNVGNNPQHQFLVLPGPVLREFPQSVNLILRGVSSGGTWILGSQMNGNRVLCGPAGIAFHSTSIPKSTFDAVIRIAGIKESRGYDGLLETQTTNMPLSAQAKVTDLQVQVDHNNDIQIKNGAGLVSNYKNRGYRMQLQGDNFVLTLIPKTDETTTQVVLLKALPEHGRYEILGLVNGDVRGFTSDMHWANIGSDWREIVIRQVNPLGYDSDTSTPLIEHKVSCVRPQADGTEITIINHSGPIQIMEVGGSKYAAWYYNVHGPVQFGNQNVASQFWLGAGAFIMDLETGEEQLVPFRFGWSKQTSIDLLENFRKKRVDTISWRHSNFAIHPSGAVAASYDNLVGVIKPVGSSWNPDDIFYATAMFPSSAIAVQLQFLNKNELIATDGTTLYHINTREVEYQKAGSKIN